MNGDRRARSFDGQATSFDCRAGFPPEAHAAIAADLVRIASLRERDVVLEIGAGTGQAGRALCAMPFRYVGVDLSCAMLAEFASWGRRHGFGTPLAVADAARRWPVADRSVTTVFGSRALHLIPLRHVVRETHRVAAPGCSTVVAGWAAREADGLRARARREMHASLARRGFAVHDAVAATLKLLETFTELGGRALPVSVAAAWSERRSVSEMIAGWRAVDGLAGIALSAVDKEAVLADVAAWSRRTFGSVDAEETAEERYMLAGVRLGERPSRVEGP